MMRWWTELLPVCVVRAIAKRHCERMRIGIVDMVQARPDVYFMVEDEAPTSKDDQSCESYRT